MNALLFASIVTLTNSFGTVKVDTLGANVISYVPNGSQEVIFRPTEARSPQKWYHGGIPVCWPWFGWYGEPGSVQHGDVWNREWSVVERGERDGVTRFVLGIDRINGCRLTYEIDFGSSLSLNLSMRNDGESPIAITTGLHPYFAVSRTKNATVKTPSSSIALGAAIDGAKDAGCGRYEIVDTGFGRSIGLDFWGLEKFIVWNCGEDDPQWGFGPDDWQRYVCVEPTVLPRSAGFYLKSGETRNIGMRIGVSALAAMECDWRNTEWIAVRDAPARRIPKDGSGNAIDTAPGTSCFLKSIDIGGDAVSARWTVTGHGVFEAYVNGVRVGDDFLKPGFTHVAKKRHSFSYDVTSLLKPGNNVLSAMVSSGWWSDRITGFRGRERAFRAQLCVRYRDGSERRFGTDATWLGAVAGPVKRASIFEGETYDARVGTTWMATGDGEGFAPVKTIDEFKGAIVPMEGPTVTTRDDLVLKPTAAYVWKDAVGAAGDRYGKIVKLREYGDGAPMTLAGGEHLVLDFGRNAAAVPRFRARGAAGTRLTIRPAEMLNDGSGLKSRGNDGPEGSVYRANLRSLAEKGAIAEYVFAGNGEESYMPRFTFFGYRHVSVESTGPVTFVNFESVPVTSIHREMDVGRLVTGNADVNRLFENCRWGMYSNYLSVPTDCPQRDERVGWTADTQVFAPAACYFADVKGFLGKWMGDMRDSQAPNGCYAQVAPGSWVRGCVIGWTDAGIIVPWTLWRFYGDEGIVRENYPSMKRYFAYAVGDGRKDAQPYGDWLSYEYGADMEWLKPIREQRQLPRKRVLGHAYRVWTARMMAELAPAAGCAEDVGFYEKCAAEETELFRKTCLKPDGTLLDECGGQTSALFALYLKLLPNVEAVAKTKDALRADFKAHGNRLQTGFLGTSVLLEAVTEGMGDVELAYTLLLQDRNPSWLYSVDQGATTIWERWNSYTKDRGFGPVSMNSFNHYAYGAVAAWMFSTMAGIRTDPAAPGFRRIILAPHPDRRIGHVDASYRSAAGVIKSSWRYEQDGWVWNFSIPGGTTAAVLMPGETEPKEYEPGSYRLCK